MKTIGHVSYINNVPFVIIRSMSDNADDDATISYREFETIGSNRSAEIVLSMIRIL